jgi:hypothetical protein
MATENLTPRVRIHEDNFAEEIKNPNYPNECIVEIQPEKYFIEVVNKQEEVIALFYHVRPFLKTDFFDVIDYAKYYDTLIINRMGEEDWIHFSEEQTLIDDAIGEENNKAEPLSSWYYDHWVFHLAPDFGIASYGRLKYPLGLDEKFQERYKEIFSWRNEFVYYTLDFKYWPGFFDSDLCYPNDLVDYLNFSLGIIKMQVTRENFNKLITFFIIEDLVAAGLHVIKGIADNLFTEDNIYLFIDQAKLWDKKEVLDYLLDYQNNHFPLAKHSQKIKQFGIGKVQFSESDSIRRLPADKNDFFLELINPDGTTKALIFIADSNEKLYDTLTNSTDSDMWSSNDNDGYLYPNDLWQDIETQRWLPEVLDETEIAELVKDLGKSNINDIQYDGDLLDWLGNHWSAMDMTFGPDNSQLPALFLMAYGRLKFPYKLSKETHVNCELYIRGFVRKRNLIGELTNLTKDPKDIAELFNFCVDVFPDQESFREAFINDNNIEELVLCDPEFFSAIADSILGKENIDRFLDEAHAQNKPELILFLLDYKNKHF